ncbi:MAG: lipopolysaccharide assembly protein LapA domain-containing protein [Bacteroidota bacterium]|jgi:putative membrane protein
MKRLIGVFALITLAMVFALQNAEPVPVRFLFWSAEGTSLALVLLLTFVFGMVTGCLFMVFSAWRKKNTDSVNGRKITDRNQSAV